MEIRGRLGRSGEPRVGFRGIGGPGPFCYVRYKTRRVCPMNVESLIQVKIFDGRSVERK